MRDLNDKITGNNLTAPEWNDMPSEVQNVITQGGIILSGADLNQLGKGIANYTRNGNSYVVGGIVNAYTLTTIGAKQAPTDYVNGFAILFRVNIENTGSVTVNVDTHGIEALLTNEGNALVGGELPIGQPRLAQYNGTNFLLVNKIVPTATEDLAGILEIATTPEAQNGTNDGVMMTPKKTLQAVNQFIQLATETVAGKVERATNTEVVTGSDTVRYVSPKTYKDNILANIPDADLITKGIVERATNAEVLTGNDDLRFVTPKTYTDTLVAKLPVGDDTTTGIVRMSTQSEAEGLFDNDNVLTPLRGTQLVNVVVPAASTSTAGKVERANNTEAAGGIDTTRYMSPANVNSHYNARVKIGITGTVTSARFRAFSNDLAEVHFVNMQLTATIPGDGTVRINFRFPFPNRCHNVQVTPFLNNLNFDDAPTIAAIDKNGCSLTNTRQSFAAKFLLISWGS